MPPRGRKNLDRCSILNCSRHLGNRRRSVTCLNCDSCDETMSQVAEKLASRRPYNSSVYERVGASRPVAFCLAKRVLRLHRYATTNWIVRLHYSTDHQIWRGCIESLQAQHSFVLRPTRMPIELCADPDIGGVVVGSNKLSCIRWGRRVV